MNILTQRIFFIEETKSRVSLEEKIERYLKVYGGELPAELKEAINIKYKTMAHEVITEERKQHKLILTDTAYLYAKNIMADLFDEAADDFQKAVAYMETCKEFGMDDLSGLMLEHIEISFKNDWREYRFTDFSGLGE
jgi:hypothetical protein